MDALTIIGMLQQAADPDWMKAAMPMTGNVQEINTFAQTLGAMGWTLPVGVLSLVVLKLAPYIGSIIQDEHRLSVERRRRNLDGGKDGPGRESL